MSFYEEMSATYKRKTETLQKEEAELQKQKQSLLDSVDHELNTAKQSVLTRQVEEAIVQGKPKVAEAKKMEILSIQEAVEKVEAEVQKIDDRLSSIEDGKRRIAKQILDETYLPIQVEVRTKFEQAVLAADGAWEGLKEYAADTGLELHRYHREGLQILYMGPTRQLRLALEKWI